MDKSDKNVNIKIDTVPYLPNIYLGKNIKKDFIDFSNAISADKTIFIFNMSDNVIQQEKYNNPNFLLFGNTEDEYNLPPVNYFYNNIDDNILAKNNYKILSFRYESSDFDNILLNEIGYAATINTIKPPKNINITRFSTTTESVVINPIILTQITLTIEKNKNFFTDDKVIISSTTDSTNYFYGTVNSYVNTTGEIIINITEIYGTYTSSSKYYVSILGNEFFRELEITDFKSNKFIIYLYYFKYLYSDNKNPYNFVNYNNFTNNIFYNKENWNIFIYPFNDIINGYTYINDPNIKNYPSKNSIYNYINVIDFSELKLTNLKDNIDFIYFETKKSIEVKNLNKTFYFSKNIKSFNDYISKNKDEENIFISLNEINYFYNETLEDNLSYLNSDTNTIIADFLKKNKTFVNTSTGTSLSMDNKICYLYTKDKYFKNTTYAQYISNVDLTEKLYDFDLIYCVNSYFDIISYKQYVVENNLYNELDYVNQNLRKILLLINPNLVYDAYVNSQYVPNSSTYNTVSTNIINLIDNPIQFTIDDTNKLKIKVVDDTQITNLNTKSYIICRYLFILSYLNYATDLYTTKTISAIKIYPSKNSSLTIIVGPNLAYLTGNIIYVSDTTNPTINNFTGNVSSYNQNTGVLIINNITNVNGTYKYPTKTTSAVIINPTISPLTLNVEPNLAYASGNSILVTDTTKPTINNFIGNVFSYDILTGDLIINNITNISGTFGSSVLYNINLNITGTNGYKTQTTTPVNINPYLFSITLTVANNLSYISGDPVYISNQIVSSNNFIGNVSYYDKTTGNLIIDNIANINGTFSSTVKYDVTFNQDIYRNYYINVNDINYLTETTSIEFIDPYTSPLTLTVGTNLGYVSGNIIYVSDSNNKNNNFAGKVYSYDAENGTLVINNITNINGNFNNETIYNINLYNNQKIQYYYIYINVAFYNSNYVNIINQFKTNTFDVCYVCRDYLNANITTSPTIFNVLKKTNMYQNILKWNFVDTKIYSFIYNYDLYSEYKDRNNSIIINNFYFLLVNIIQNITHNDGENDYIINNFNNILFEKINNFISNVIILNNTNSTLGYNKYLSRTDNLFNIITDTNINSKYYTEFKYLPVENSTPDDFSFPVSGGGALPINYLPFGIYKVFKFNNYNPSSYVDFNPYISISTLENIVKYNYQLLIRVSPPYEYDDEYYNYINYQTKTKSAVIINPYISPVILTVGSNLAYVTGNRVYVSDTTNSTINNFMGEVNYYDTNNGILIINNITNINGNFNNEVIYNVNLYNNYNDFINNNNSLFTNRCEMYLILSDINGDIIYVQVNRILCYKLFNFYTGEQNIFNRLQLYVNTVLYNNFYSMNIIYEDYYPYYIDANSSNLNNINTMALNYNKLKFIPHINDYVKDVLIYDLERFNNNIYNISELYYNIDLLIDITKNNDNLYKIQQIIDNCVYLMYLFKVIILLKRIKCYFIILNNLGVYYKFPVNVPIDSTLTIDDFYKIILNDIQELKDACNYIYNLNFFTIAVSKLESFVSSFKDITILEDIYLQSIQKLFFDNINVKYLDVNNISLIIIYVENLIIDFTNNKNDTIINITDLTADLNILNYSLQIEVFIKKYNDTFRILNYFENSINELKPETKELFLFKNQTLLYLYNINSYYDILNFNKIFDNEFFHETINSLNLIKKDYIFSTTQLEQNLKYSYFCISKFIKKFNDDPDTSLIDFDLEILKTVEEELKDNIYNYQNNISLTSLTTNLVLIDISQPTITLLIQPNKAFVTDNQVTVSSILNSSNYFKGTVITYDSTTGEIVITPTQTFGTFTDITRYYVTVPLTINNENLNSLLVQISNLISNYALLGTNNQYYLEFYYINDIVYYLNKYVYLIKELLLIDAYKKQILSFPTIDNPDPYDVLAMNLNENIISLKNIIINIDSVYKDKNQEIIHEILNDNTFNNIYFYSQINVFSYNDHLQFSSNNFITNVWNPETYDATYTYTLTSNNYVFGYIINTEIYTLIETLYQSKISFFDVYKDVIEENILIKNALNYGFVNIPLSYKS